MHTFLSNANFAPDAPQVRVCHSRGEQWKLHPDSSLGTSLFDQHNNFLMPILTLPSSNSVLALHSPHVVISMSWTLERETTPAGLYSVTPFLFIIYILTFRKITGLLVDQPIKCKQTPPIHTIFSLKQDGPFNPHGRKL